MNINVDKNVGGMLTTFKGEGCSIDDEVMLNTPNRVSRMYNELLSGYFDSPEEILGTIFNVKYNEMILVTDIEFSSLCEHHMLPFYGKVHVAYQPEDKIVGLSKIVRLVKCYARRLQLQERMTSQIADSIMSFLCPKGAAVVVSAEHMCMAMRGVNKPRSKTVTSAIRGIFKEDNKARMEFLQLIKMNGGEAG